MLDAVRGLAFAARALERELGDMTLAQVRVLTLIATDPQRACALAERAAMARPTLTGLLDGLVAKGWVARDAVDGDRRGVRLTITAAGRHALRRAEAEAATALDALLDQLPPGADRAGVVSALAAVWQRRVGPVAGPVTA